jgi:hypothetical protein
MIPKSREIRSEIQITSKTDITRAFFDTDHKSFIKKVRLSTVNTCLVPIPTQLPYSPDLIQPWHLQHLHLVHSQTVHNLTETVSVPQ